MSLKRSEKIFLKRARYLHAKSCPCGESFGHCLNFYKDKPIDWNSSYKLIEEFIKDAKCLCYNCWAKLHNGFLP